MTFLSRIFGFCPHTLSFPMMRKVNGKRIGDIQTCTTCGKEWPYDFTNMRRIA